MRPRQAEALSQIEQSLLSLRLQVAKIIGARLPSYLSKDFWEKAKPQQLPKPLSERDPAFVQFSKHVLFALRDLETLTNIINEYSKGGIFLTEKIRAAQAGSKIIQLLYNALAVHLSALAHLANEAGLPATAMTALKSATDIFSGLKFEQMLEPGILENFAKALRPIHASLPLFVDQFLNKRPPSPTRAPAPELKYAQDLKQAQEPRQQWLKLFLEPVRSTKNQIISLTTLLTEYIAEKKAKGAAFNASQEKELQKLLTALKYSKIDENGFYLYSVDETPLSQSIKALFNMLWTLYELQRGFLEKNKLSAYYQAINDMARVFEHYKKIDWSGMGADFNSVFNEFIDRALIYGRDTLAPPLAQAAQKARVLERQMQLVPGTLLSEDLRALFDPIEACYLSRGIPIKNPLAATPEEKLALEAKHQAPRESERSEREKSDLLDATSILLQQYRDLGKIGAAYRDLASTAGGLGARFYIEPIAPFLSSFLPGFVPTLITTVFQLKPPVVSEALQKAGEFASALIVSDLEVFKRKMFTDFPRITLLQNLALLGKHKLITPQELPLINRLEDHLISELSLAEKQQLYEKLDRQISDGRQKRERFLKKAREYKNDKAKMAELERLKPLLPEYFHLKPLHQKLLAAIKIEEAAEKEANKTVMGQVSRSVDKALRAFQKNIKTWPPQIVKDLVPVLSEKNKRQAALLYEKLAGQDALVAYRKTSREYALHYLQQRGINFLLMAAKQAAKQPAVNLPEKRQLAVIVADLRGEPREANLEKAHQVATQFANDPKNIKGLITPLLNSQEKNERALGHALAVETLLTGHINDWGEELHPKENESFAYHDLHCVTGYLAARQILLLIREPSPAKEVKLSALDQQSMGQAAVLKLILMQQPLTRENLATEFKNIDQEGFSKAILVKLLVACHADLLAKTAQTALEETPEFKLRQQVGITIGQLACADKETAQLIFQNASARTIVEDECVKARNIPPLTALYYEALVNSFSFKIPEGKQAEEKLTHQQFIAAHQKMILEVHQALNPQDGKTAAKVLNEYSQNPWTLAQLIDTFISKKISPGSQAETQLREFFSAFVLCTDNHSVRLKMLEIQRAAQHSVKAPYLKLLTSSATEAFWNLAQADLINHYKNTMLNHFEQKKQEIHDRLAGPTFPESKDFLQKIDQFISGEGDKIIQIVKALREEKDLPVKCRHAQQEMKAVREALDRQYQRWLGEIHKNQQLKLNRLMDNFEALDSDFTQKLKLLQARPPGPSANNDQALAIETMIQSQRQALQAAILDLVPGRPDFLSGLQRIQETLDSNKASMDEAFTDYTNLAKSTPSRPS